MIDPEGNFFRYYPSLLIVKEHTNVLEPWTHEILLEVPQESFLQVTLASEEVSQMVVKVFKKTTGTKVPDALTTHSRTDSDITEKKRIWKLEAHTAYMIEVEYAGDMYNDLFEEEMCLYFDMTISINSLKSLGQRLACSTDANIDHAPSLLNALP